MLAGLAERRQEHDCAVVLAPVGYPCCHLVKPDPQLPHCALQVIRPWSAKPGAVSRGHTCDLIDPLQVAEAVQPLADFGLQFEGAQIPGRVAHAGHGRCCC
jgi:hypothetical protein